MARAPVRRPGQLRFRVDVQRRDRIGESSGDGAGNYEQAWRTFIDREPASIEPRSIGGGEQVIAGRLAGVSLFDVWVRVRPKTAGITVGDRLIDAGDRSRIFNIRFVEDLGQRRRFLLLQCEQGVAD